VEIDADGATTYFDYDVLGRMKLRIKEGLVPAAYPVQPNVATRFQFDAEGRTLSETTFAANLALTTSNEYDLAGRLVRTVDPAGLETHCEYADGGRMVTVVRPGGATEITENYLDGRTKSITGTGSVPRFYDYGVNADGSQWTLVRVGATNSPQWEKTTTDMLGRTIREERPGFGGTVVATTSEYNDKGQLAANRTWAGDSTNAPLQPATLYEYDEVGDLFRTATDVNGNGTIDLSGPDRINETQTRIVKKYGALWRETLSKVYATDGSANPVVVSAQRRTMQGEGGGSAAETQSLDVRGNLTKTTMEIHSTPKTVRTVRTSPDSTVKAISVVVNGLLQSETSSGGLTTTYGYDGLGRAIRTVDPRMRTTRTTYNDLGQVDCVEDSAGHRTSFAYDPDTGLQTCVIDALSNEVHTSYDLQGRPTNVWGATYPVAYEYDAYGRMAAMKTWRDANGAPDVTRWFYDEATGLLTNKVYADGSGPSYEYDATGRLTKRTWARGVTTTYAYDALGQLTNVDYSDDTPDVSYTYDRMGRPATVTDALGMRSNVYDAATLDLVAEQLPDGHVLARSYDRFGRPTGIALGADYQVAYAYDDVGRFAAITSAMNAVTTAVKYAYLAQSDLLAGWTVGTAPGVSNLIVQRSYEPRRDLVATVQVANATGTLAHFVYVNDPLGRRVSRNDARADGTTVSNVFGYNVRSELEAAVMGANQFGYQYDAIGNRQAAVANDQTVQYEANALNQYASILPAAGTPAYDADGNMTSDGTFIYSWDAENRLTEVRSNAVVVVQNAYDFTGRRVWKATAAATNAFLYDGWLLIRELSASDENLATNSYLWGLDLSGSLQGAGGVGGLLCHVRGGRPQFSFYDANGNVTGLVDTNGDVVAQYDYDPFGNLLAQSGDQADANPFRFSSKPWDEETGLYYYGYRFYSPTLGRWVNRDPRGEEGGLGIYLHTANDPVNEIDPLGESLFAIDGTWRDDEGKTDNVSNVCDFYMRSTEEPKKYSGGPGSKRGPIGFINGGMTGAGSAGIANDVYADACAAYCTGQCEINLVGWSRGAVIAVNVADMLNSRGCPCQSAPVPVNFVGLYDAVEMMPGSGSRSVPPNVKHFAHAIKTGSQLLLPTRSYGGNEQPFDLLAPRHVRERIRIGTGKDAQWRWRDYWTDKSTHSDIGASQTVTRAHAWIISEARAAGVDFK